MDTRAALITGGGHGIGRAAAVSLAAHNWGVVVAYRSSMHQAAELQDEIRSTGGQCLAVQADVSDPKAVASLVAQAVEEFGRIDALINCAGPYRRVPILEESLEGWHSMFDSNLHSVFYLSRLVTPGMIARGWGRIINFSTANADQIVGQPFITAHYIAKVGVLVLTRSLAKALGKSGITVNAISPGFIDTGTLSLEEIAPMVKNIPAGHMGAPADAAALIQFLLSDQAAYINGANIHLSGGWGV
jgi:3-oxoacyl-[acyl-carrier protein] reductase